MKIADFGLAKLIDDASLTSSSSIHGMVAYIDPQCFKDPTYKRSLKSDVYSYGVILWEISSGREPFPSFRSREAVAIHIFQGYREVPVEDTPQQYFELYKHCWDNDPNKRPEIKLVLDTLNTFCNN